MIQIELKFSATGLCRPHDRCICSRAGKAILPDGIGIGLFNQLNWKRSDPVALYVPAGTTTAGAASELLPGQRMAPGVGRIQMSLRWTKGIVGTIRWIDFSPAAGGGFSIFDRGAPGRETMESTPIIHLVNAETDYHGYSNS